MTTYPLALTDDLLEDVKRTAQETGLSQADAMRQALKFGLPQVRQRLSKEDDLAEVIAESWEKLGPAPEILWDKLPK